MYRKQSPTKLPHAKNSATVVPINGTQTQCTTSLPPIKERLSSDAERMVNESPRKLNWKPVKSWPYTNQGRSLTRWMRPQCTTYRTIHAGLACRTRFPPTCRSPSSTSPSAAMFPWPYAPQGHHQLFFQPLLFQRCR